MSGWQFAYAMRFLCPQCATVSASITPGPLHLPVLGANGDLTAQQCAGTRAAATPATQSDPAGRQQPVNGGRARRLYFRLHFALQQTRFVIAPLTLIGLLFFTRSPTIA
jgi:hypothetical protein